MVSFFLRIGLVLTIVKTSFQASSVDSSSYIGAVVEYHGITFGADSRTIAEANANNYRSYIQNASAYHVDIIVFPEYGLTTVPTDENGIDVEQNASDFRSYYRDSASKVPAPNETVILCDTDNDAYAKSLQIISCAAREYRIYVAVNHLERIDCESGSPDCAQDGFLIYNTNIVFDRNGRIVARYRKYNPFDEAGLNITSKPEVSIFQTDFGVTFGQLVCFDLIHEAPAMFLANNTKVTDIIYSTHWYDLTPFLESTQIQAAWAYAANVNFLASGYNNIITATGGSGIFAGNNGPIRTYHPRQTSSYLLIAEIPKRHRKIQDIDAKNLPVYGVKLPLSSAKPEGTSIAYNDDLTPYNSELLKTGESSSHITTLCDRKLCCDFHVESHYDKQIAAKPGTQQYRYRLVVLDGVVNLAGFSTIGVEICALVSCTGDSLTDCGKRYSNNTDVVLPTTLNSLIITRRANLNASNFNMPTTVARTNLEPLNGSDYGFVTSGHRNSSLLLMYLAKPRNDVETFGIYGRRFDRDGDPPSDAHNGIETIRSTTAVLLCTMMMMIIGVWMGK